MTQNPDLIWLGFIVTLISILVGVASLLMVFYFVIYRGTQMMKDVATKQRQLFGRHIKQQTEHRERQLAHLVHFAGDQETLRTIKQSAAQAHARILLSLHSGKITHTLTSEQRRFIHRFVEESERHRRAFEDQIECIEVNDHGELVWQQ